jgi:alpha-tubulin suppressor-like RCC1 family protein
VQIGAATNWAMASSGGLHSLAITTGGALYAWGDNTQGQCGQGAAAYNNPDLYYPEVNNGFCVGPSWTWYSSPEGSVAGYDSTGTICDPFYVTWQFSGVNTRPWGYSLPVQVGALTTWSKVSAGNLHSMAVKTDGTLWAWGDNGYGQLGTSNTTNRSSPVQVGALTTWANVFCGSNFTVAIKTDGTLWAWGDNISGQLGQGNTTARSSPVQVGTATNWLSTGFSAGAAHTLAIRS